MHKFGIQILAYFLSCYWVEVKCDLPNLQYSRHEVIGDGKGVLGFYTANDMLALQCKPGYKGGRGTSGYQVIRCNENGKWEPNPRNFWPCIFVSE